MKRQSLLLPSMVLSLLLLIGLQLVWLRSEYTGAYENLRKETGFIFRQTIMTMQDSLMRRNIVALPADTLAPGWPAGDSLKIRIQTDRGRQVRIFSHQGAPAGRDSLFPYIRPLLNRGMRNGEVRDFMIRMDADSLRQADVKRELSQKLAEAEIFLPFEILRPDSTLVSRFYEESRESRISPYVALSPFRSFMVKYEDLKPALWKSIAPQVLFSIFLTLLTAGSFLLMYRSLRLQQQLVATKNDFINNVTHELKTPVATVSVALEAIKNFHAKGDSAITAEYLDMAQSEINRLIMMTDKILKAAAYDQTGLRMEMEPVALDQVLENVVQSMRMPLEKQEAQLRWEKKGNSWGVNGHADHLTNVAFNLMDNALKYGQKGVEITIGLEETDQEVVWTLHDTGMGIAPEHQQKVFDKFYRVPHGDVHNTKGYGLGLNYVAQVVKAHGGSIHLHSRVGEGSTFTVRLPRHLHKG
jgi:two-component system, OmpR family, phosphate regulon sensor histidine kinase PhoR